MQSFQVFFPPKPPFLTLFHKNTHMFISKLYLLPENPQPGRPCTGSINTSHDILSSLTSISLISKAVKLIHYKSRYRMWFPDIQVQLYPHQQTKAPNVIQNSWIWWSPNITGIRPLSRGWHMIPLDNDKTTTLGSSHLTMQSFQKTQQLPQRITRF